MNLKRMSVQDYHTAYTMVFNPANEYPGYRPEVSESPDGDIFLDKGKHFAHIACKYLDKWDYAVGHRTIDHDWLYQLLYDWTEYGIQVAIQLGLPMKWWPNVEDSTIRILAYPPGTVTHPHYDFDLFTLPMYRNIRDTYEVLEGDKADRYSWVREGALAADNFHYGELATLVNENYMPTKHQVRADEKGRTQYAAVFFAMPRLDLTLPTGVKVADWLEERKTRSRSGA